MPRLTPSFLRRAEKINPLLPLLLRACRDLRSAQNELRWLTEYARGCNSGAHPRWKPLLLDLCKHRSQGVPLQYLLGSEYFGELEIRCGPGVLIPRQETASSVSYLASRLRQGDFGDLNLNRLRVIDVCTGTGCIPLLLHRLLSRCCHDSSSLRLLGVDVSPIALHYATLNRQLLLDSLLDESRTMAPLRLDGIISSLLSMSFIQADVLPSSVQSQRSTIPQLLPALRHLGEPSWDVLISNPPYISSRAFATTTSRSVRKFEPRVALVPSTTNTCFRSKPELREYLHHVNQGVAKLEEGDLFYPRLLDLADEMSVKVCLFEVADLSQASRVSLLIRSREKWKSVEMWRDEPTLPPDGDGQEPKGSFRVLGRGCGRSVVCWR
ncbi:S-adenosyl-L-methionine-dependent methyltransferase [Lineolata rhizophorae]|uniref:S-adenosyl-L-methionine-dependent methyltransferase n=1 Tax=Lineolata rhizophorae TaxID=578093 RepID=A0A6A6PF95_9PEZI|nr:S-adenosyl-L-methionine-dependent methyltransferase [Lineolata rhizophorae]